MQYLRLFCTGGHNLSSQESNVVCRRYPAAWKLEAKGNAVGLYTVELVLWAEIHYGIEISDEDASEIRTVGQFCRYITNRVAVKDGSRALPYQAIFEQVTNLLVSEYEVSPELITENARFAEDLGLG